MILDATAANRTMWKSKDNPNIIYLDMEKRIPVKPTIFANNTQTPFTDKSFTEIFYDPPHGWEYEPFMHYTKGVPPDERYPPEEWKKQTYYGWMQYKNQQSLIVHIYKAQKEFHRILTDDGLLWVKWNECRIKIDRVLALFEDWDKLMKIKVEDPTHTKGWQNTWWVVMAKIKRDYKQSMLLDTQLSNDNADSGFNAGKLHS